MAPTRKQQFEAALALAGMTAAEFAAKVGVSKSTVSKVISGQRTSARVDRHITALIAQHLRPRQQPPNTRRQR